MDLADVLRAVPTWAWVVGGWAMLVAILLLLIRRTRQKTIRFLESLGLTATSSSPMCVSGVYRELQVVVENVRPNSPRGHGTYLATLIRIDQAPTSHVMVVQNRDYDSTDRVRAFGMIPVGSGSTDFDASYEIHVGEESSRWTWQDPNRCHQIFN